jgi:Xaa-Pro aminopeptidase
MIAKRLETLRSEMLKNNIDIYIIPSIDPHNSEYVPEVWQRRAWISNFTGSQGEVVVSANEALLWTDGRYFLSASMQLDSKLFKLMKQKGFIPETEEWLKQNCKGKTVAIDPKLISVAKASRYEEVITNSGGELYFLEQNLVDNVKTTLGEKLAMPNNKLFTLDLKYCGESSEAKLAKLRLEMAKLKVQYFTTNILDEIAWVLNIRGSDIDYNPLVICNLILAENSGYLFIDKNKISSEVENYLSKLNIKCLEYSLFGEYLSQINGNILIDDNTVNYWILDKISNKEQIVFAKSPIILAKACKNEVELKNIKIAHIKDAVAVIQFLSWLKTNWKNNQTELSCAQKLLELRQAQQNFICPSFNTISGFGSNSAIIHYAVNQETNKVVNNTQMYLLDSGGQYLEGTTDITRTLHLGDPSNEQKLNYTLVLKGHLALARATFPHGTKGENLDVLARMFLWKNYKDYNHGTGHGVGAFLCVHEGPQRISQANSNIPLLPGMIVSNEPGFYIDGQYGIRIENLVAVECDNSAEAKKSIYNSFYNFNNLTLVPYCKKLIEFSLLNNEEIEQIKTYYTQIKQNVVPHLDQETQTWALLEMDI